MAMNSSSVMVLTTSVAIFLFTLLTVGEGATSDMPCRNDSMRAWRQYQVEPHRPKATIQCGLANQMTSTRIVSGNEMLPNEFPWMAFLTVYFWSKDAATCGGTVIGDRWILTAAHCTYGAVNITVTLGAHDVSANSSDANQQAFLAKSFITHPLWRYGDVENDVALIELPQAVVLSDYIRPACLPYSDDPDQVGDPVTLTGWGNYSTIPESGLSPVPRKVLTSVISSYGTNGECQTLSGVGAFSGDKVICGDGSSGRRYCYGDDGGPMNYYNSMSGTFTVVGIAGIGDGSVNCQSSRLPTIYARVRHYVDWIYNNTDIQPVPKPTTTTTSTTSTTQSTTTSSTTSATTTTSPATTTTTTTVDNNNTPTATASTTVASETTSTTRASSTTRSSSGTGFDCRGKPNGVYPNPNDDCSIIFYMCSNGYTYEYVCPDAGTVFNPELCDCDFPGSVAGCNNA